MADAMIDVMNTDAPPAPIATLLENQRAVLRYLERHLGAAYVPSTDA
jgi:hypothetical protein